MPSVLRHAENAHAQPSDRAGDAVAIKIERGKIGRADVGAHIHLHAVDDGEEVLASQPKGAHRLRQAGKLRRRLAVIDRGDIAPPLLELIEPLAAVAGFVGDVVHRAAEGIDVVHRLPLRARQDAHGGVERAARGGGRRPVIAAIAGETA